MAGANSFVFRAAFSFVRAFVRRAHGLVRAFVRARRSACVAAAPTGLRGGGTDADALPARRRRL
jgi:hypothetical protein